MEDVTVLVARAADGDDEAWAALVERYVSLVWAIARNHLGDGDAPDVVQTVWLRLVEHLDRIADPRRLAGWLSTTTRRECMRVRNLRDRERAHGDGDWQERRDPGAAPGPEHEFTTRERDRVLHEALDGLDQRCRLLLRVLAAEPPPSYEEVSQVMDMPVGSIGPTRGRCLDKLRKEILARGISEDALRSV